MFSVDEQTADAVRLALQESGELAAVAELRRRFPLLTDGGQARACVRLVAWIGVWRSDVGGLGGHSLSDPELVVPFKANQDRRHCIPKQRHRVMNWPEYDAALRQRGSLTVWFTEAAIAFCESCRPALPGRHSPLI